jgi:hypothetical protein
MITQNILHFRLISTRTKIPAVKNNILKVLKGEKRQKGKYFSKCGCENFQPRVPRILLSLFCAGKAFEPPNYQANF